MGRAGYGNGLYGRHIFKMGFLVLCPQPGPAPLKEPGFGFVRFYIVIMNVEALLLAPNFSFWVAHSQIYLHKPVSKRLVWRRKKKKRVGCEFCLIWGKKKGKKKVYRCKACCKIQVASTELCASRNPAMSCKSVPCQWPNTHFRHAA